MGMLSDLCTFVYFSSLFWFLLLWFSLNIYCTSVTLLCKHTNWLVRARYRNRANKHMTYWHITFVRWPKTQLKMNANVVEIYVTMIVPIWLYIDIKQKWNSSKYCINLKFRTLADISHHKLVAILEYVREEECVLCSFQKVSIVLL